jgi:hypothetical protein
MSKPAIAILQIFVGILVVYAVYMLSLALMQQDKLFVDPRNVQNPKSVTKIIPGYVDSTVISNRVFNTIMPMSQNYMHMPRSFNRQGGAQYSISFWIFVDDPEEAKNKTILIKGDNRTYSAAVFLAENALIVENEANSGKVETDSKTSRTGMWFPTTPDIVVQYPFIAAPCITFGERYDQLGILFNTVEWPFGSVVINPRRNSDDDTKRRDAMKLIAHKWALFTFVLEDNVAADDFEDGISVRFYLNDMLYFTERVPGSLRINKGNLHLFPEGGIPQTRIADVTYYNYAINQETIKQVYEQGPPNYYYPDIASKSGFGDPLYLSEYNKLDIYNA